MAAKGGEKREMGKGRKKKSIYFNRLEFFAFLFFGNAPEGSKLFDYWGRLWSE
jgi:hypothetical protein